MKKQKEINGVLFDVKKPIENYHPFRYCDLFDCYERPSQIKINIYEYWKRYANTLDCEYFTVASYNGFMFTLSFDARVDGKLYNFYITKTRNEISEIIE